METLIKFIRSYIKPTNWSKWYDLECFEVNGYYYLLQIKINKYNNKKVFRRAKMGFINDYEQKEKIFKVVMRSINYN